MTARLLVIADDFTGATDIAGALAETGRTVRVHLDGPREVHSDDAADAEIYALKIRSGPPEDAVEATLQCLEASMYEPTRDQVYFKYCSTFDSTKHGNIGPVLDTLIHRSGATTAVVVPAFPDNGRTQYLGYLFVNGQLLAESPMAHHPITPMQDSSVLRLLAEQASTPCRLVPLSAVRGPDLDSHLRSVGGGPELLVTDAVDNKDLSRIASAVQGHRLVSGGSGLAQHYNSVGAPARHPTAPVPTRGRIAIVGSQSEATNEQLAHLLASRDVRSFIVDDTVNQDDELARMQDWISSNLESRAMLVVSRPERGGEGNGARAARIERLLAGAAAVALEREVREIIVAGGETSGAVLTALDASMLFIGPEISPGVPWCTVILADGSRVNVALKSGNFGAPSFFTDAWEVLDR